MQGISKRREPPPRFDLGALRAFAAAIGVDPEAAIVDNGGPPYIAAPEGRVYPVAKGRIFPSSDGFLICPTKRVSLSRVCQEWSDGFFLDRLPTPAEAELVAAALGPRKPYDGPKRGRGRPRKTPIEAVIAEKQAADVALVVLTRAKASRRS
jgi:hypothetical protein